MPQFTIKRLLSFRPASIGPTFSGDVIHDCQASCRLQANRKRRIHECEAAGLFPPEAHANWRKELLEESRETIDHLKEENWHEPDIADRASLETEAGVELRTRNRYLKLISKIDSALRRIEDGSYGFCEETGDKNRHQASGSAPGRDHDHRSPGTPRESSKSSISTKNKRQRFRLFR